MQSAQIDHDLERLRSEHESYGKFSRSKRLPRSVQQTNPKTRMQSDDLPLLA